MGGGDMFVVKYHANDGSVAWSHQIGSDLDDTASYLTVDNDSIVFVSGSTFGSVNSTDSSNTDGNSSDCFLVKILKDGDIAWIRQFKTGGHVVASRITVDSAGTIGVHGYIRDDLDRWGLSFTTFDTFGSIQSSCRRWTSPSAGGLLALAPDQTKTPYHQIVVFV